VTRWDVTHEWEYTVIVERRDEGPELVSERVLTDELVETPLDKGRPIGEDDERVWGVERLRECSRRCPLNELR
jgi:hypothetical protein